jgi:CBS domain-containing protein
MRCDEVMSRSVAVVGIDDTLQKAAGIMRERRVGFLPVCDPDGRAIGAITDRDLVVRGLADSGDASTRVDAVMTRDVMSCGPEDDLALAEALMGERHRSRVMVCDDDGGVLGVISLSDVGRREVSTQAGATLRAVTSRTREAAGALPSPRAVDVMKRDVVSVRPDAPASEVARLMRDEDVGFVPVCRADGKALGVVTDRDLALRAIADGRDRSMPVRELMSREVIACAPGDELARAGELMATHRKSRLPVCDACDLVVGVISLSDVAEREGPAAAGKALHRISARETSKKRPRSRRLAATSRALEGRTRQQLYATARTLGIAGRSTMAKSTLIDAIRAAR